MAWALRSKAGLSALLLLLPVLALAQGADSRNIYCCESEQGQSVCADVLPLACYGRAYREISPRGAVLRSVAAPLTPAEAARLEAENRRKAREEAVLRQQRRFDAALLETYRSLEEIDVREERALADVDSSIADIRRRQKELAAEREELEQRIEGFAPEPVPEVLQHARRAVGAEYASYERVLVAKLAERAAVVERYATDRRRYAELMAGRNALTP